MAFLSIEHVTKRYGKAVAVDDLSLDLERGQCLVLLGPSGCGKTTTLNIVAGFLAPDGGAVRLDGADISRLPPHKRDMGMVFQDYALFPHMVLRDNVAFGLKMRGIGRRDRHARAEAALNTVGLAEFAGRLPAQLSGGQRQRVALARALVIRPRLLLFDEPLSNLDTQLREQLRTEIRGVLDETGLTAIMVTHDQSEALAIGDQVALLRAGHLVQAGPPAALYARPATRFAAGFLGGCNLFDGRAAGRTGAGIAVTLPGGVAQAQGPVALEGGAVTVAVRPHCMRLDPAGPVGAVLDTVEFLGAHTRLTAHAPDGTRVLAELAEPPGGLERGQALRFDWAPSAAWLVPAT